LQNNSIRCLATCALHYYRLTFKFEIIENNIHNEKLLAMVKSKIYTIRGQKVMFDFDLAQMYGVETRVLNQAVKRNIERFPEDFMFQLTKGEYEILKSQILALQANKVRAVISNIRENEIVSTLTSQNVILKNGRGKHSKYIPYAFTENGVAMLSSVLRSPLAIQVNIGIMRAFTEFRKIATGLSLPSQSADVAQLRKDFEELKLDIEDILHDQNDINESTRTQLEAISTALAELQMEHRKQPKRRPIGFIQPKENDSEDVK